MVTRRDYTAEAVKAAKRVLIELAHRPGEYRNDVVVVGGWVPDLLLANPDPPHTGSMDIDLALDHRQLREEGYRMIRDLLLGSGYRQGRSRLLFSVTRRRGTLRSLWRCISWLENGKPWMKISLWRGCFR